MPKEVLNTETTALTTEEVATSLSKEAEELIARIVTETDEQKTRDLTQLFNTNQAKKTLARVSKLSDLLDIITDQALTRFTRRPDELSNKELFDGLKVVQDLVERGQKQVAAPADTPLIQVNQQNNEINLNENSGSLSRESRERVKNAVATLLRDIQPLDSSGVIATEVETTEAESETEKSTNVE